MHPIPGEKTDKRPKRSTDIDGSEVIIDACQEGMARAQFSALQITMEKGFSQMTESFTTVLSQIICSKDAFIAFP